MRAAIAMGVVANLLLAGILTSLNVDRIAMLLAAGKAEATIAKSSDPAPPVPVAMERTKVGPADLGFAVVEWGESEASLRARLGARAGPPEEPRGRVRIPVTTEASIASVPGRALFFFRDGRDQLASVLFEPVKGSETAENYRAIFALIARTLGNMADEGGSTTHSFAAGGESYAVEGSFLDLGEGFLRVHFFPAVHGPRRLAVTITNDRFTATTSIESEQLPIEPLFLETGSLSMWMQRHTSQRDRPIFVLSLLETHFTDARNYTAAYLVGGSKLPIQDDHSVKCDPSPCIHFQQVRVEIPDDVARTGEAVEVSIRGRSARRDLVIPKTFLASFVADVDWIQHNGGR